MSVSVGIFRHAPRPRCSMERIILQHRAVSSTTSAGNVSLVENQMTDKTRELARALSRDDTDSTRRLALARAITLVESTALSQRHQGDLLLTNLLQSTSTDTNSDAHPLRSFRVGVAGAPGVGKSTFIERFGLHVLDRTKHKEESSLANDNDRHAGAKDSFNPSKLAVVCIDPSSNVSGGSILGDKTRMPELARHDRAFVRPSANGGLLGGLSFDTYNVVSLCQMAGYGLVVVESVGLGQSEIEIAQCVDLVVLLVPPGGGDELQGVKKGIVEVADMILVHKADGDLLPTARSTAADYRAAMKFLRPKSKARTKPPPVLLVSSHTGDGMDAMWQEICSYQEDLMKSGELQRLRQDQDHYWMWKNVQDLILAKTQNDHVLRQKARDMEEALSRGTITPRVAASELLNSLYSSDKT